MLDVKRLIGEVAVRNGIRIESWDPAFILVTLNELVLEEIACRLIKEVHSGIAEFTEAVHKTEGRAGKILALQVQDFGSTSKGGGSRASPGVETRHRGCPPESE